MIDIMEAVSNYGGIGVVAAVIGAIAAVVGVGFAIARAIRKYDLRLKVNAMWMTDESNSVPDHYIKIDIANLSDFPVTITRIAFDQGKVGMVKYSLDLNDDESLPKRLESRHGGSWNLPITGAMFSDDVVMNRHKTIIIETSAKEIYKEKLSVAVGIIVGEQGYGRDLIDWAKKIENEPA